MGWMVGASRAGPFQGRGDIWPDTSCFPWGLLREGPGKKPREGDVPKGPAWPGRWLQGALRTRDQGENTEHPGQNRREDSRVTGKCAGWGGPLHIHEHLVQGHT